ncbi:T9SS type A sorting domain-containing protein [Aureibaculum conchae]|uniref:T9SS type A sorting domain-containing protein n=1 Tax=Aureibaculum sp. 2308TA14-22 TaxID=3108392 RepID=UPI003397EE69
MKLKLIILLLLFASHLIAQTTNGDIEDYIGAIIDNAPGNLGDDYSEPSLSQLTTWNTTIDYLLTDNLTSARSTVNGLNYQITEFTDTSITPNQVFYVLEEKSPQSKYWGTYVFSKTSTRNNLIIQAPHSKYDTNTGKQAVYCFKNTVAKALFINGTHRCNSDDFSSCSGTTSVCGSSDSYRKSDLAHNVHSVFQKTTENLFIAISNSVFIQLHGFGKKTTDPYVIMSNGTRETPATDYATQIKDALLVEDSSLTFKLAHIDTDWTRLIGFTNTQGRLINNSADFCLTSASTTSGRFVHIEQEKSKLRNNEAGWNKMSNALASVFESTLSTDNYNLDHQISVYPNPTKSGITIKGTDINSIEIYNTLGQQIELLKNSSNAPTLKIDLKPFSKGIYHLKINSTSGIASKKIIYL